jgi:hypothetical protein
MVWDRSLRPSLEAAIRFEVLPITVNVNSVEILHVGGYILCQDYDGVALWRRINGRDD